MRKDLIIPADTATSSGSAAVSAPIAASSAPLHFAVPAALREKAVANLYDFFSDIGSEVLGMSLDERSCEILAYLGMEHLTTAPVLWEGKRRLLYGLGDLSADQARQLLTKFCDQHLVRSDIYRDDALITQPPILQDLIPELAQIASALKPMQDIGHSYMMAFSMRSGFRDVSIAALCKREPLYFNTETFSPQTMEELCLPSMRELLGPAKEFDLVQLKPFMEEMNTVQELYNTTWPQRV